jgi:hypothetical protein
MQDASGAPMRRMAARCSSTRSATRRRDRVRSCASWSTRRSSAAAPPSDVDVRIISSTGRNSRWRLPTAALRGLITAWSVGRSASRR